jgi:hypothetical protein
MKNKAVEIKYNNTTEYSREFYKLINSYKAHQRLYRKSTLFWITILLLFGGSALAVGSKSFLSVLALITALIIIPVFQWLIPLISDTQSYSRSRRSNNGNELIVTAKFDNDHVMFRNNIGQHVDCAYTGIKQFKEYKNELLVFSFGSNDETYLSKKCFTLGDSGEFVKMINKKVEDKDNSLSSTD